MSFCRNRITEISEAKRPIAASDNPEEEARILLSRSAYPILVKTPPSDQQLIEILESLPKTENEPDEVDAIIVRQLVPRPVSSSATQLLWRTPPDINHLNSRDLSKLKGEFQHRAEITRDAGERVALLAQVEIIRNKLGILSRNASTRGVEVASYGRQSLGARG